MRNGTLEAGTAFAPSAAEAAPPARNACKTCAPLGACVAYKGLRGCVPYLHGSQGCATYIRRYLISHFREPVDIASSAFSESSAVFGGGPDFEAGVGNLLEVYRPEAVGAATTCLADTIGEDLSALARSYALRGEGVGAGLLTVSTPSYQGTHLQGFHKTVRAIAEQTAEGGVRGTHLNLLPGFVSPADIRTLANSLAAFGLEGVVLPDFSDTLDGGYTGEYRPVPEGGTSLERLAALGRARATIEWRRAGETPADEATGAWLQEAFGVPLEALPMPVGLSATDSWYGALVRLSGWPRPRSVLAERARLLDACIDAAKYLYGKRAIVFGDQDLSIALARYMTELGVDVVLCAFGEEPRGLPLRDWSADAPGLPFPAAGGMDHAAIGEAARELAPDFLLGPSKGYPVARELGIPLVRAGFPVHDRIGAGRLRHLLYEGAVEILDRVVNALLEHRQDSSPVGYPYY